MDGIVAELVVKAAYRLSHDTSNLLAQSGLPGLRNVEIWSSAQLRIRLSLGITPHYPIVLKTPASNRELLSPNTQQVRETSSLT